MFIVDILPTLIFIVKNYGQGVMFKFTLERQISFAFLVAFLILITISIFSYRSVSNLTEALKRQKQTQQTLKNLDESLILMLNVETGGRGYILTGKESFLQPYYDSKDKIAGQIGQLKNLLGDNPQQLERIFQLESAINEKLDFVKNTNDLNRNNQTKTSVEIISNEHGREIMESIRQIISSIEQDEIGILNSREEAVRNNVKNTYWMLLLGSIGGVISIGLANLAILRETTKRSKAEKDLKEVNKNLETLVEERTGQLSKVNQELKAKSDFVQVTLDSLSANIAVVDKNGNIIITNERWNCFSKENQCGDVTAKTGIGNNYLEVCRKVSEKDEIAKQVLENLENILDGKQQTFRIEYPCHAPHIKRWFILQINSLQNEAGNAVISHFDITDRKKAENELKESEEFSRSIVENSPDCIKVLDLNGTVISINANGMSLMEVTDSSLIGRSWMDFWEDETRQNASEIITEARNGQPGKLEGYCRTLKDNLKYWEVSINPIFGEDGKPIRLVSTSRDLTKRKEAEQEREKLLESEQIARREAEIANHLRDEFLATLSHELRAPLNSILGWGKMLQQNILDGETQRKAIETIVRNAHNQNRMIEDLLDVSRIISGKVRLEITKIRLTEIVEEILESVHPAADAKNISLEFIEDTKISHVSGDPNRLQQVIWNLVSNAIKFTPKDGKIFIETERINSEIKISVRDTGIGIKEEFLPYVFKRFSQADSSSIRKFGGLGIGLAIVRHLTEMHGGTVSVFSEGENKGSTFTITLPVFLEFENIEQEKRIENPTIESLVQTEKNIRLDGMLVLVVDDEIDSRLMLVQALTLYGATVVTASSAREALEELETKNPDVLISDVGMPDEDGYSLIRKVRGLPDEKSKIPAIAVTAFTRKQDRNRALAAGFQNHIAKPVEFGNLVSIIADLTADLKRENL